VIGSLICASFFLSRLCSVLKWSHRARCLAKTSAALLLFGAAVRVWDGYDLPLYLKFLSDAILGYCAFADVVIPVILTIIVLVITKWSQDDCPERPRLFPDKGAELLKSANTYLDRRDATLYEQLVLAASCARALREQGDGTAIAWLESAELSRLPITVLAEAMIRLICEADVAEKVLGCINAADPTQSAAVFLPMIFRMLHDQFRAFALAAKKDWCPVPDVPSFAAPDLMRLDLVSSDGGEMIGCLLLGDKGHFFTAHPRIFLKLLRCETPAR
jgi:hypothetical protein